LCLPNQGRGLRLLDAGCGTGASTAALLSVAPHADIVAIDASRGMLDEAKNKSWPSSVRFVHTPVEGLAENGIVGPFDGILAAYLIRNLSDPDTQLKALRNLLAPGATLAVHGVARGLLEHHHSLRLAANPGRDPVQAFVAQRVDIRRRNAIPAAAA
jgi:ubiquinone/menaquinone biosynthesis C-methylase UbiE